MKDDMENRIAALEKTAERHEGVIEILREQLQRIHDAVIRVDQQLTDRPKPGESPFCASHLKYIEDMKERMIHIETEMDDVRMKIHRWAGAIALAVFLGVLFGPSLRMIFHLPTDSNHIAVKPSATAPAKP